MKRTLHVLLALIGFISLSAQANDNDVSKQSDVEKKLLSKFALEAKKENPKFTFSVEAGREFYTFRRTFGPRDVSCSACHTDNPANEGKHLETKKPIKPLAPAVNPDRFTDAAKAEKAFAKHCMDLLKHDCTAQQKGDFLTYLMSVK